MRDTLSQRDKGVGREERMTKKVHQRDMNKKSRGLMYKEVQRYNTDRKMFG